MRATTKAFFWVITLLAIIVVSLYRDCGKLGYDIVQQERKSARQASPCVRGERGGAKEKSFRLSAKRIETNDVSSFRFARWKRERHYRPLRQAFYRVTRVVDGDTIQLSNGEKVRYIGVDTPETKHPRKPVEYFGKEAARKNKELVGGKKVRLEFDVQKRDRYRRLLAYVYLDDGTFVNAELVSLGYARVMTIPPNIRYQDLFMRLQREARKAGRGLWQEEGGSRKSEVRNKAPTH